MKINVIVAAAIACVLAVPLAAGAAGKGKKAADPAAPPAGVHWAIEPSELDFGEVAGGESKALGLKLFNQGDKEGTARCAASGPGARYVVLEKTGPLVIPAVGAIEVRVTLDGKSALFKKGAKPKEKDLKEIPVKASVTCGGKRADIKAVVKPRTEEEIQKNEPPPPPKADEIPGL